MWVFTMKRRILGCFCLASVFLSEQGVSFAATLREQVAIARKNGASRASLAKLLLGEKGVAGVTTTGLPDLTRTNFNVATDEAASSGNKGLSHKEQLRLNRLAGVKRGQRFAVSGTKTESKAETGRSNVASTPIARRSVYAPRVQLQPRQLHYGEKPEVVLLSGFGNIPCSTNADAMLALRNLRGNFAPSLAAIQAERNHRGGGSLAVVLSGDSLNLGAAPSAANITAAINNLKTFLDALIAINGVNVLISLGAAETGSSAVVDELLLMLETIPSFADGSRVTVSGYGLKASNVDLGGNGRATDRRCTPFIASGDLGLVAGIFPPDFAPPPPAGGAANPSVFEVRQNTDAQAWAQLLPGGAAQNGPRPDGTNSCVADAASALIGIVTESDRINPNMPMRLIITTESSRAVAIAALRDALEAAHAAATAAVGHGAPAIINPLRRITDIYILCNGNEGSSTETIGVQNVNFVVRSISSGDNGANGAAIYAQLNMR
jgi:hypothetical protein